VPMSTQLEWTITTLVIGLPRQVVVQRYRRADVDLVLRERRACVAASHHIAAKHPQRLASREVVPSFHIAPIR